MDERERIEDRRDCGGMQENDKGDSGGMQEDDKRDSGEIQEDDKRDSGGMQEDDKRDSGEMQEMVLGGGQGKGYKKGPTITKCLILFCILYFVYQGPACGRRVTYRFVFGPGQSAQAGLGEQYYNDGEFEKAAEYYQQVVDDIYARGGRFQPENGPLYYRLGVIYYNLGEYEQAVKYLDESADVDQRTSNREDLAWDYFAIGRVLREAGKSEESVDYYRKGLKAIKKVSGNDSEDAAEFLIGLGDSYKKNEEHDKALESYRQALEIYEKHQSDPVWIYIRIARSYEKLDDYASAESYYRKASQTGSADNYTMGVIWFNLGMLYQDTGKGEEAFSLYQEALTLINKDGGYEAAESSVQHYLASAYAEIKNDLDSAIRYSLSACRIREELASPHLEDKERLGEFKEQLKGFYQESTGDGTDDGFESWYWQQMEEGGFLINPLDTSGNI